MATNILAAMRYQGGIKAEIVINLPTIPVSGNAEIYTIVPEDGVLESADVSGSDAFAADPNKYATFSITNLGQDGLGTKELLAAVDGNTTKSGSAANARRKLVVSSVASAIQVKKGDRLRVRSVSTGTLGNTVTNPVIIMRFVA